MLTAAGVAALLLDAIVTTRLEQGLKRMGGWLPVPAPTATPMARGLPTSPDITRLSSISEHVSFWFFFGCVFVTVLFALWEAARSKRLRSSSEVTSEG